MATAEALITAEEYGLLPDNGQRTELVRGRIVPLNMPYPRHGEICANVVAPDFVFELCSSGDGWCEIFKRVAEYLKAGVKTVSVLDEHTHTLTLWREGGPPEVLRPRFFE